MPGDMDGMGGGNHGMNAPSGSNNGGDHGMNTPSGSNNMDDGNNMDPNMDFGMGGGNHGMNAPSGSNNMDDGNNMNDGMGGGNHGMNAPAPSNRMNYGDESSSGSGPCTGMEEEVRQAFTHEKLDIIQSNACRDCLQSSENNGCGLVDSDGSLQALANGASNNDNSNDGDGSQYCGPGTSFDAASGQCHATYEGLITACEQERGDWGWTCKNIAEPCDDGK